MYTQRQEQATKYENPNEIEYVQAKKKSVYKRKFLINPPKQSDT